MTLVTGWEDDHLGLNNLATIQLWFFNLKIKGPEQ